jgi:FkbM family methyltransferase
MPLSREEHVDYTRREWTNDTYFVKLLEVLKKEKIESFLDLGSNVGEVVNVLIESIPELQDIYIFEPQVQNMIFLKKNIEKNISNKNIHFFDFGIYYGERFAKMFQSNVWKNVGGFQVEHARKEIYKSKEFPVLDNLGIENWNAVVDRIELKTFEELDIPVVDFIKIDVEMSEYNIIENSTYLQECRLIDIEYHSCSDYIGYTKKYFPNHNIIEFCNQHVHVLLEKKDL